mgnify:CR=1 FL=1
MEEIQEKFGTQHVIRTMPNTPASIMEGMTVWYHAKEVAPAIVDRAKQLLEMTGTALLVSTENTLDMVGVYLLYYRTYLLLSLKPIVLYLFCRPLLFLGQVLR